MIGWLILTALIAGFLGGICGAFLMEYYFQREADRTLLETEFAEGLDELDYEDDWGPLRKPTWAEKR